MKEERTVGSSLVCVESRAKAAPRADGTLQLTQRALHDASLESSAWNAPAALAFPFTLGVASGDPRADSVVLWTRLAPVPLGQRGGMPARPVTVHWELANDDQFRSIEQSGSELALPERAHSIHIEVEGLSAYCLYWYRFRVGAYVSAIGCTRTLPDLRSHTEGMRFAVAWAATHAAADSAMFAQIARDDLDFVLFAGTGGGGVRPPQAAHGVSLLDGYRHHLVRCKLDPARQAAQRAFAWISLPSAADPRPVAACLPHGAHAHELDAFQQAAARRAFCEHMPVRQRSVVDRSKQPIALGPLATLHPLAVEPSRLRERASAPTVHGANAPTHDARARCRAAMARDARTPHSHVEARWQLFVQTRGLTSQAPACEQDRYYVRCELDRDSFRTDFLAYSTADAPHAPPTDPAEHVAWSDDDARVLVAARPRGHSR